MQLSEITHFFSLYFFFSLIIIKADTGVKNNPSYTEDKLFLGRKSRTSNIYINALLFFTQKSIHFLKTTIKLVDLFMQDKQLSSKTHAKCIFCILSAVITLFSSNAMHSSALHVNPKQFITLSVDIFISTSAQRARL